MRWSIILLIFVQSLQAQVFEYNTIQKGQWNGAGETYSDVWGYAANGREYAIIGSARYIYFFDVTNPANITLVDKFGPYTSTSWREFKTYGHYAYAVTDGADAGGLRIFDLQNLPDTVVQVRQTTAFFGKCHMPFIDEANGRLYCAGTDSRNNGIIVLDLSVRPDSPSLIINQAMPRGYIHDVYVKNNVMYASHIYSGYISQYNCTGSSCTGELSTYQTTGYNHSSFMNADQTYLINAIETAGHPLWYFPINGDGTINGTNIKKFKSKTLREQYPAGPASDTGNIGHNPYIVGNLAYVSYYTDGVQVFDISNVNNIRRVAYFDTDRGHTAYTPVFRGCWGTYPFLPSGNILASDIQSGLWVFSLTPCAQNTPPSISISSSSSTYPTGSNIAIQATASDNGTISKVDFYNGTSLIFSDNSFPYTHTISNAQDPSYTISAKVYDDCGEITVSNTLPLTTFIPDPCAGNTPPTISISSSASSYVRGTSFTVNATSSDNGTITKVDFYNNGVLLGTDLASPYSYSILNAVDPTYTINAIAYDNCGATTGSNTLSITTFIPDPCAGNTPPTISISSSASSYVRGTSFTVNASSSDNGTITKVDFYNNGVLLGTDLASPYSYSILNAVDPTYTINAIAYDDCGATTGSNTLTITTFIPDPCAGNTPPTISISSSTSSYVRGTSFTVNASSSDNGTITKVDFYNNGVLLGTDLASPYSYSILNAVDPTYTINAIAYDNCGATTGSNTLTIITFIPDPCAGNTSPTISISSSASSYVRGTSFTVNASSSDNGTITKVNFYNNGVLLGTDLSSPYSHTINPANSASYSITARSYDNCGDSSTSSVLTINTTVSCSDGVQNGTETGVDCGGNCTSCGCTSSINLSLNKTASQSTTQSNTYRAGRANDGVQSSSNYSRTRSATQNWWEVDLAANYKISSVIIRSRINCSSCVGEIKRFRLFVTNSPVSSFNTAGYVYEYNSATGLGNGATLTVPVSNVNGRYVRIYVDNGSSSRAMSFSEVTVMGCAVPAPLQADPYPSSYVSEKSKTLLVYPNPFADYITVSLDRNPITEALIQVFDLQGRLIYTQSKPDKIITLHHMHPGTYILKAITDEGIYTSKIVKY